MLGHAAFLWNTSRRHHERMKALKQDKLRWTSQTMLRPDLVLAHTCPWVSVVYMICIIVLLRNFVQRK